jgi:hypothetical protein
MSPGKVHRVTSRTLVIALMITAGCNGNDASRIQGQTNAQLTFYGLAVDQDGKPLEGVSFDIVVDAIPKDWTFENRGRPHDRMRTTVVTDADGRFSVDVAAHVIFVENGRLPGYRHLFAKWSDDGNTGYQVTAWGEQLYKSAPDHAAVYVFVKDGVREVSALPCRGGYQLNGKQSTLNLPRWPRTPSLPDVVRKQPGTPAATTDRSP